MQAFTVTVIMEFEEDTTDLTLEGFADLLAYTGERGKVRFVEALNVLAMQIQHGPTMLPTAPTVQ